MDLITHFIIINNINFIQVLEVVSIQINISSLNVLVNNQILPIG